MTIATVGRKPVDPQTAPLGLLLVGTVLAVLFVGINFAFPDLAPTGIPTIVTRAVIHAAILGGLWLGLLRTDFWPGRRAAVWLAIAVPFTLWLAVVWDIAISGGFQPIPGLVRIPRLPIAIFAPVIVGVLLLTFSKRIGTLLDAMPASWLVGLQVYRVFGGIFLVAWTRGTAPGVFALPAGIGDLLTGIAALSVAGLVPSRSPNGWRAAMMWNLFGLADFAIAITTGALSSPGPLQILNLDGPVSQVGAYPTVMIPAFGVPSSILLHALSIRQLLRIRKRARSGPSIA